MAGTIPPAQPPPGPRPVPSRGSRPWHRRPNPLRRPTDRFQARIGLGLLLAVLVVAPVAGVVAEKLAHGHYAATARHQALTRHEVDATLTEDVPRHPEPGSDEAKLARYPAEVRLTTPDGRTATARAEVPPGLSAGSRVRVWVTADGEAAEPPLTREQIRSRSMGCALLAAVGTVLTGAAAHAVTCRAVRRRNLAAWERAWAETAPRWTTSG
ncbi:Rv1733c family protein [Streptomyces prasinus]|uniref:Rv1733c family protein n=1 Tax=Streptomyces prasinus TaxID=67345 RepID=UPI003627FD7A